MNIRRVSNFWAKCASLVASTALFAGVAQAEPALQIDIDGGTYDATTEDVVTSDEEFTLLALCKTAELTACTDTTTFFLSISLKNSDGDAVGESNPAPDLGYIVVNGVQVDVTGDMSYGTPPLDDFLADGDLAPHGAFPAYFWETAVDFNLNDICGSASYNVANTPGQCTDDPALGSYFDAFEIDASNLAEGYGLHFDLYNASAFVAICDGDTKKKDCTKDSPDFAGYDINLEQNGNVRFAPFSKDASYRDDCCEREVPEPGTLGLLGIGLLGLGFARRRKAVA